VADNALFITIAQVLAACEIRACEGAEAKVEFEAGAISHPVEYKCGIVPRSDAWERVVRRSVEAIGNNGGLDL
jgi:hypothetical protein